MRVAAATKLPRATLRRYEGGKVSVWESEVEGPRRAIAGANNGGKTKTGVVRWIE